jgi:hypothetical protein
MAADGSDDRALPLEDYLAAEPGHPADRVTEVTELQWSPDGAWLVLTCQHGFRLAENIWVMRPDGSDLRPVAQGEWVVPVR